MGIELPKSRLGIRQINVAKRQIPLEQIIATQGYNPLAEGIQVSGAAIGKSLLKRAELRKQGDQLAKMETLSGLPAGSFTGLDPTVAANFTSSIVKEQNKNKSAVRYVIPNLDNAGNVSGFTEVPQGYKPTPFARPPTQPKPNAASQKSAGDVQAIDEQLNEIDDLSTKLSQGWSGPIAGRAAVLAAKATGGGMQQPISEFEAIKPAFAVKVYRAWTGDTRLSDSDAASRAYPLLPNSTDQPQVQKAKWDNLRTLLNTRKDQLMQGASVPGQLQPISPRAPMPITPQRIGRFTIEVEQ